MYQYKIIINLNLHCSTYLLIDKIEAFFTLPECDASLNVASLSHFPFPASTFKHHYITIQIKTFQNYSSRSNI